MKACKDCKHKAINGNRDWLCDKVRSLITDNPVLIQYARTDNQGELHSDVCGREGRFWEAK